MIQCVSTIQVARCVWLMLLGLVLCGNGFSAEPQAVVVSQSEAGVRVELIDPTLLTQPATQSGLFIGRDFTGQEFWDLCETGKKWPTAPAEVIESGLSNSLAVRGFSGGGSLPTRMPVTIQLQPLGSLTVIRGASLISPRNRTEVLTSTPIFRRASESREKEIFPDRTATLTHQDTRRVVAMLRFSENQRQLTWKEIKPLHANYTDGLPEGIYSVRFTGSLEQSLFFVASRKKVAAVMQPIAEMKPLCRHRPATLLHMTVEHLLSFKDRAGTPQYLSDVLDILADADAVAMTDSLKEKRDLLNEWLTLLAHDPGYRRGQLVQKLRLHPTGIPALDTIRQEILSNNWNTALRDLAGLKFNSDDSRLNERGELLTALYQGVVLAELGPTRSGEAAQAFETALAQLGRASKADQFLILSNAANFHRRQAADVVENHAFQIASGLRTPFLNCLHHWKQAEQNSHRALQLAEQLNFRQDTVAVELNLAELHLLLSDVLSTLGAEVPTTMLQQQALKAAERFTHSAVTRIAELSMNQREVSLEGTAFTVLAQITFRQRSYSESLTQIRTAERKFLNQGNLAGLEQVHRIQGLIHRAQGDLALALTELRLSEKLSELLRTRTPLEQTGVSRVGFFARRSFVYDTITEILLEQQQFTAALQHMERGKARTAVDVLGNRGVLPVASSKLNLETVCPAGVVILEYFLSQQQSWVFCLDETGKVTAHRLQTMQGSPISSVALIRKVREFLWKLEKQAEKMRYRLIDNQGFDHTWQNELAELTAILLPESVLKKMKSSREVVIVPQHILHYFPFPALVTETDKQPREPYEMVAPRFLVDEKFSLMMTPSLTIWSLLNQRPRRKLLTASAVGAATVPGWPSLPGVELDLKLFQQVFGDRVESVLENATESRARELLRRPGILLFASHGFHDPVRPLKSALMLQPEVDQTTDQNTDGSLTARELLETTVTAELVVMSACYSGLGDGSPLPGDDLFGLQRALLQSGVRTVVSGLWDVYDETAPKLMLTFFQQLKAGNSPAKSLATAQRTFLDELRNADTSQPWIHPYFWSVYSLSGGR